MTLDTGHRLGAYGRTYILWVVVKTLYIRMFVAL
jgi:hypothetical protein